MKYKFLTAIFLVIFALVLFFLGYFTKKPLPVLPAPTPLTQSEKILQVTSNEQIYNVYLQPITDTKNLLLIPNFSEKKFASQIFVENKCTYGANGSFYTPGASPLGVFYLDGKYLNNKEHLNKLFNGFFSKSVTGNLLISKEPPPLPQAFIFQSGPLFSPDTKFQIEADEPARRVLIGQTNTGEFYLIAVTNNDNQNSGPELSDLPGILKQSNNLTIQQFILILNLDGGSASAFFDTKGHKLNEITQVGSFLCGF